MVFSFPLKQHSKGQHMVISELEPWQNNAFDKSTLSKLASCISKEVKAEIALEFCFYENVQYKYRDSVA